MSKKNESKKDFTPHGARPIRGHFNPALVRACSDEIVASDKFIPDGIKTYCIETAARDASLMLSQLSREEQGELEEFAVCVDMGYEIGVDDDPFVAPDHKAALGQEAIERDVNARREAVKHDEMEEVMATQIIAIFRRSPVESATDSIVTSTRIPRFEMTEIYPTTQRGYDALMVVVPPRRDDEDAGYIATPGEVKLAKDALYGEKPTAANDKLTGTSPRSSFARRAGCEGSYCRIKLSSVPVQVPPAGSFNPAATKTKDGGRKVRIARTLSPSSAPKPLNKS